jgi:hypothetical protein
VIEDEEDVVRALRSALPPRGGTISRRDLWAEVVRRVEAPPPVPTRGDWLVAVAAAAGLLLLPEGLTVLLYLL